MGIDKITIVISEFFSAADERNWFKVRSFMADEVLLDYACLSGNPASLMQADQIVEKYKNFLPGFDSTRNYLYDFKVNENGLRAVVSCKAKAHHFIEKEKWVVEGSYNTDLEKIKGNWLITMLQLASVQQRGNLSLPLLAAERSKTHYKNLI